MLRIRPAALVVFLAAELIVAIVAPFAGAAPPGKTYRLGILSLRAGPTDNPSLEAFRHRLPELGYIEGRNVVIEARYADGKPERLPDLAAELVRLQVDVIVTQSGVAALAARRVTRAIPIVMVSSGDAVRQGLVASLARPGGNVTGVTLISPELSQKRLELLREMVPTLSRVGVLWCGRAGPDVASISDKEWAETRAAAEALKVTLLSLEARGAQGLAKAFASVSRQGLEALIVFDCSVLSPSAARITELAMKNRLPALYPFSYYAEAGGLMAYGPDLRDMGRRAASCVDKILKGAKPEDLPVEQPTKFELVINLNSARALGLAIPPSILARTDQVIE